MSFFHVDDAFVVAYRDSVRRAYLELCRKNGVLFASFDDPPPPPPTLRQRAKNQLRQLKWKLQGLRHLVCCGHGEDR